jgi:segregation and condensation protein A
MAYTVKLQQFEGPLSTLLQLIEADHLNISEVSLAKVTDDYVNLLEANPEMPPEELADFLVIASRLLLIKSKLLLPHLQLNEGEDSLSLEAQLRIYKSYLDASKVIEEIVGKKRFLYVHDKLPKTEIGFSPPRNLTALAMRELFLGVIKRLAPLVQSKRGVLERTVSIHDKITQIRDLLSRSKSLSFHIFLKTAETRMEVIISFLALLELIKQKSIYVTQSGRFDDIAITETVK